MRSVRLRRGVTLLELIVAIAILGVLAGVAGVTLRRAGDWASALDEGGAARAEVRAARSRALATGQRVTATVTIEGRAATLVAFPDGSVAADDALAVDRLSGRVRDVAR